MTRAIVRVALLTLVLLVALYVRPDNRELIVEIYLLLVAAVAIAMLVRRARDAAPVAARSAFDRAATGRAPRVEPPPDLLQLEREITMSVNSAHDLQFRLVPAIREIAAHRLMREHAISLDADPDAARELLGEPLWSLVQHERAPVDRHARGLPFDDLRTVVAALERI